MQIKVKVIWLKRIKINEERSLVDDMFIYFKIGGANSKIVKIITILCSRVFNLFVAKCEPAHMNLKHVRG